MFDLVWYATTIYLQVYFEVYFILFSSYPQALSEVIHRLTTHVHGEKEHPSPDQTGKISFELSETQKRTENARERKHKRTRAGYLVMRLFGVKHA